MEEEYPSPIYRLVGYGEYSQALQHFENFVRKSSREEIGVADRIVQERDEYAIYSNLSSRVESRTNLSASESRQLRRHGLAWMMALARVEVFAMLAGFSPRSDPYRTVPPTKFERTAYAEVMLDAARIHYWALRRDSLVAKYWQIQRQDSRKYTGLIAPRLIAYGRRTMVTMQFLNAAQLLIVDSTSFQRNELYSQIARCSSVSESVYR